ncbi:hypothetical protein Peur_023870 [Populus x canadensis]
MEYERIHKVQTCIIISPSKLRMKLMGPHHHRHKDGSNGKSSRTSPSKLEDTEFFNDSLFASNIVEISVKKVVAAPNLEVASVNLLSEAMLDLCQAGQISGQPMETVRKEIVDNGVAETKLVDFCQPASHMAFEKFSFAPPGSLIIPGPAYGVSTLVDQCAQSTDLKEVDKREMEKCEPNAKMVKKIAMTRQRLEEKQAAAEARNWIRQSASFLLSKTNFFQISSMNSKKLDSQAFQ